MSSNQDFNTTSLQDFDEKLQYLTEYFLDLIIKNDIKGVKIMHRRLHELAVVMDKAQKELDLEKEDQKN